MSTPELYTQETIVYARGVAAADIARPVFVYEDTAGHHALSDGNHRATRAFQKGVLNALPRTIIGTFPQDVSKDPNFRPISQLVVVEK